MSKINLALIGFGYWGPNYSRVLTTQDGVNLKWICDLEPRLLKEAKKLFPGVLITEDYRKILTDKFIDAVIVATPTVTHAKVASDALTAGKHVLVEKPLATSLKDAVKLEKLAKARKKVLMVGHTYLFNPAVSYLKKEIAKGTLGNILFFIAQRTNLGPIRSDVNAMWDLAPHDISTILYLTDSKFISVNAAGVGYLNKRLEDVVQLTIKFERSIFASIIVSWLAPIKIRNLTIVGDRKMAIFDEVGSDAQVRILDKSVIELEKGQTIPFSKFKNLSLYHGDVLIPQLPSKEPLKEEVFNFINSVIGKDLPVVTSKHVLEVVKILETAQKFLNKQ